MLSVSALVAALSVAGCGDGGSNGDAGPDATALTCPSGQTACNGACSDTVKDPENCGACGTTCVAGQVCSKGACALTCAAGTTACGQSCTNLESDNTNCGACGTKCGQGEVCSNGKCGTTCQPSETMCTPDGGAPYCASTQTDNANCGTCGNACPQGQVCSAGQCQTSCQPSETMCTPDGGAPYCASTQTDNANCGTCGNGCPQGQVCTGGQCAATCASPLIDCNNQCVDPRFDPMNCNGCNKVCPTVPQGTASCDNGACGIATCDAGFRDCDGQPGNGCETNVAGDKTNCGGCGVVCPAGNSCTNGACKPATIALESVTGSCYQASSDVDPLVQSLLTSKGYSVALVDGNALATPAGIDQYGVVVIGAGSFSCAWDWSLFDGQLQTYVMNGGSLVVTGWADYYLASNTKNETYPGLAALLPLGASTNFHTNAVETMVGNHPITNGVSSFTNPTYTSYGPLVTGATTLVTENGIPVAAAWTVGLGRVVYLGPIYLANFSGYPNKPLLDGTIPDAQQLFLNSIAWALHQI